MNIIAFWFYIIIIVGILVMIIISKRFRLIDFVMAITMIAATCIIDTILSDHYNLYLYISDEKSLIYGLLYDVFVYPVYAVLFSQLMTRNRNYLGILKYILVWAAFLTLAEMFIFYPFKIIVYTVWKIIPYSLLFYLISLPVFYLYYRTIEKKLKV